MPNNIFPVHPLKIWATKRKIHLKKLAQKLNTTYVTIYRINEENFIIGRVKWVMQEV